MISHLTRTLRQFTAMFRPPFEGLWLLALLYFGWAYAVFPHSPILRGNLPDTDDYMYLNQVLDWLKGQGWYDNVQHRLDPRPDGIGGGAPIHFSRLAMLPMAGLIWLLERTGLGPQGAATIMAVFYPLALLGILFGVMRWLAADFMPRDWRGVTAYLLIFAVPALYLFEPGHVDHHGLILIILAAGIGCLCRMAAPGASYRWAALAGVLMAFGLCIALEILPWLLLIAAWIGIWALVEGGGGGGKNRPAPTRHVALFGLSLHLASAAFLLLTRPPSAFFTEDVLTYSVDYVYLTGGIAVCFVSLALTARAPGLLRWLVAAVLACVTGGLFLHRFPDLIAGPYGGMDPALAQLILGEINEAQPLKTATNHWIDASWCLAPLAAALPAGIYFLYQSIRKPDRLAAWRWALVTGLLLAATGFSTFYQRRYIGTMSMLAVIPLAVLLQRGWQTIGVKWRDSPRPRVWAEIGLILLVGPLLAVVYPALIDGRSFNKGILLYPVATNSEGSNCDMYNLEHVLRDPRGYGDRPRLIMGTLGIGPELLFRTPHQVLSAPYHMDVAGNLDATRFFSTPYPEEAEAIARRRHIDLVVACHYIPEVYLRKSADKALTRSEAVNDFAPHFIQRLMTGQTPAWLKRVKVKGLDNYVVYEMVPEAGSSPQPAEPEPSAPPLSSPVP